MYPNVVGEQFFFGIEGLNKKIHVELCVNASILPHPHGWEALNTNTDGSQCD